MSDKKILTTSKYDGCIKSLQNALINKFHLNEDDLEYVSGNCDRLYLSNSNVNISESILHEYCDGFVTGYEEGVNDAWYQRNTQ